MKKPVVLRTKSLDSDRIFCTFICTQVPERSYVVESPVNFLIVGSLSATTVFLDVHAARNDQQNAVACSTASSHEDLREVTSISSSVDLNSQSVFPNIVSQKNGSLFGIPINSHGSLPSIYSSDKFELLGCKWFLPPTNFGNGYHHNLRINFGFHHAVLHEFFIHHDVLGASHTLPTFSQFSQFFPRRHWDVSCAHSIHFS